MEVMLQQLNLMGQHRLAQHIEKTSETNRCALLNQLRGIDLPTFFEVVRNSENSHVASVSVESLKPCPVVRSEEASTKAFKDLGEAAIRRGELAFFVVAGGQGSRLGFEHPKGMFPAAPVSGRSLFQLHIDKIVAFGRLYGFVPHFVVMTSPGNHAETVAFLEENAWFGLPATHAHVFSQGELPAVDDAGNLILASERELFMAPDGHGGSLSAIVRSGVLEALRKAGVKYLSYFQIDNPMVAVCDSSFLGVHIHKGAEVSTKVIAKRDALEKLGNPMTDGKQSRIIEYSDLPEVVARKKQSDGELLHAFGSIGVHIFCVEFVERIVTGTLRLPFHVAKKSIPCFNPENQEDKNFKTSGRKFEQFVFDSIPLATQSVFVETRRADEFAPLKNKNGEDSIASCREMQSNAFKRWLVAAGYSTSGVVSVEVSPLFACTEEKFSERAPEVLKSPCSRLYLE
jgi:UDP-N-acetylglucosamine/UDP-N-acetylgalactosamine diphosphorylase